MAGTTAQHQAHPYTVSRITDRHVTRGGVIQVPKAGADGTAPSLIKVHAQYQYRVVDFLISEMGAQPLAPKAEAQEGEVLKYANVILEAAEINLGAKENLASVSSSGGGSVDGGLTLSVGTPVEAGAAAEEAKINKGHIFTVRGRYIFVRTDVITQDDGYLKFPQQPYDTEAPIASAAANWKTTLLGNDSSSGNSGSGSVDGANVPPSGG